MANIERREARAVFGELGRRAKLYSECEEALGLAIQAEDDMKAVQKEIDGLRVEKEKVKVEFEQYAAGVEAEKKGIQLDLDDSKVMAEKTKREVTDSAEKDAKIHSGKAISLRREVEGLIKQRESIFAELPIVRAEVDAEVGKYRDQADREKKKIDAELSDSQSKLKVFKTNIAGVSG